MQFLESTESAQTTNSLFLKKFWDFQRLKLEIKYISQVPTWHYRQYGQNIMDKLVKIGISGAEYWAWGISVDVGDSKKHLPIYTNQKSNTATPVQCRALKVFPTCTFHLPIYTLLWTPNPQEAHCFTSTCKQLYPTQSTMLHSIGNSVQRSVHQSAYSDQEWCPIYFVLETLG